MQRLELARTVRSKRGTDPGNAEEAETRDQPGRPTTNPVLRPSGSNRGVKHIYAIKN